MSAVDTIENLVRNDYKYGFVTEVETESVPPGLNEDIIRLISAEEERAGVHARVAPQGLSTLADHDRAQVAERPLSAHRLPEHRLLLGAQAACRRAQEPGRSGSRNCSKPTRSWAFRCTSGSVWPAWRWMRCSTACPWQRRFKEKLAETGHHLLLVLRSRAGTSGPGEEIPGLGGALHGQLFRHAELGGLHRRLVLLHPQGRALPDGAVHLFPHQRRQHGPVRAHADRRRRRRATSATWKAARRPCATKTSCTPRSSNWSRWTMRRSSIRPSRTGIRATKKGKGGIYNFVTKRGLCKGRNSKISWTQVETGSAITWKYPSCILQGDNSVGEFYSVAVTNNYQQADTGTKMIHIGKNTRSTIVSKGISAGHGQNSYRGLVKILKSAAECAQLFAVRLAADRRPMRRAHLPLHRSEESLRRRSSTRRRPRRSAKTRSSTATSAGCRREDAVTMIVNGFCKEVFKRTADGVRGRSAEAAGREPGRQRGLSRETDRDYDT